MQCSTLLRRASKCQDTSDLDEVMSTMQNAFDSTSALKNLGYLCANDEAHMEGNDPFLRIELAYQISPSFVLSVNPEIRNGTIGIGVRIDRMLDGLGVHSKSWELWQDCEEFLEAEDDESIARLAARAKAQALAYHAELIESVGVPRKAALRAAKAAWPKTA